MLISLEIQWNADFTRMPKLRDVDFTSKTLTYWFHENAWPQRCWFYLVNSEMLISGECLSSKMLISSHVFFLYALYLENVQQKPATKIQDHFCYINDHMQIVRHFWAKNIFTQNHHLAWFCTMKLVNKYFFLKKKVYQALLPTNIFI